MNTTFFNMMVFCNTKEMVTRIGQLTNIKPVQIYCANCQKLAAEVKSHARISQDLMLCVVLHVGHSRLKFVPANLPYDKSIHDGKQHYANLLKAQNQYLANYKDFHIGGVSDKMLSIEFEGETLYDHLELQGIVGHITHTVFTETKGIWQ
eukprot:10620037-Ditylum_brightwellii.AAC.1